MSCGQCCGIEDQFGSAEARKKLRQFRRRGPDKTTRMLIEDVRSALAARHVSGAALVDIGAGIGAIHHELLNDRVATVVHIDASSAHMAAAREETARRGHVGNVTFTYGDFVALADTISAADVVTLDRVICCFDDMPQLVDLSARKARRFYAAVYPRDVVWMRMAVAVLNLIQRLKRTTFRVFIHDPRSIHALLQQAGLTRRTIRQTMGWEVVVYERVNWGQSRFEVDSE